MATVKNPYALPAAVAGVMAVQALLGLLWPDRYRDGEWVMATWFGNDSVTLLIVVPLLIVNSVRAADGSRRALLATLGLTGYAVYNSAFYLFGAALSAFFPIYVLLLVSAVCTLIVLFRHVDENVFPIERAALARLAGGYFIVVATGLASAWLWLWAAYVFRGRATPIGLQEFRLIVALDLSVMVPLLLTGGLLLWRRNRWGVVISAVGGVVAVMYLLVLSVNAAIAIYREFTPPPGELPLWGTLFALTTLATLSIFVQVQVRLKPDTLDFRLKAEATRSEFSVISR
jgi:hypothetical protein